MYICSQFTLARDKLLKACCLSADTKRLLSYNVHYNPIYMKRRIIWGALLLLTFLTFYSWMPAGMYMEAPIFLGIIGTALCLIFIIQVFADFKDLHEISEWNSGPTGRYRGFAALLIPFGVLLIVIFSMHYTTLEEKELKKYGVIVPATIVDGYSRSSSKSSTYKLTISYYDKKGKYVRTEKEVSSSQYGDASKGQHVEVIYSTIHPQLVRVLLGDDMVKEFTGITSRRITLDDMTKMLSLPEDSILPALNKISYRWTYASGDSSSYVNNHKNDYFHVEPRESVSYLALGQNVFSIREDIDKAGFEQDTTTGKDEEGGFRLYTKGDLKLVVRNKTLEREQGSVDSDDLLAIAMAKAASHETGLVITMFRN